MSRIRTRLANIFRRYRKFNKVVAAKATIIFGTMEMFYAFFIYGLLPLIPALSPYESQLFYWSGWVQLWALPLLLVGSIVLAESKDKRDTEQFDKISNSHEILTDTVGKLVVIVNGILEVNSQEQEEINMLTTLTKELHTMHVNSVDSSDYVREILNQVLHVEGEIKAIKEQIDSTTLTKKTQKGR